MRDAYTDAHFTRSVCGGPPQFNGGACTGTLGGAVVTGLPVVTEGVALPSAPWTVELSSDYSFAPINGMRPYLRVDYELTTAQRALVQSQNPADGGDSTIPGLPDTRNLQARAGLRWGGVDVSLFGQNLTDSRPVLFGARDTLASGLYFNRSWRPRTFGVTGTYRF